MDLRPEKDITKILISTTSRFVGEYMQDDLLLTHAWPSDPSQLALGISENPLSRNYFVCTTQTPQPDPVRGMIVPDHSPIGHVLCIYLSILYGKRFDDHGRIESIGHFFLPHVPGNTARCNPSLPFNRHAPRPDLSIPLNLEEVRRIQPLLTNKADRKFEHFLQSAGRFYLHALQEVEDEPEVAFLDLITCGEILSNYFEYDQNDLLDEQSKLDMKAIEEGLADGRAVADRIRGRIFQVRQRFTRTVLRLLNPYFFQQTEAREPHFRFTAEGITSCIKAAYDLRSKYVHTGVNFGIWATGFPGAEVQIGTPVIDDNELKKLLAKSPTFFGLERIMRFCLLRFTHLYGCRIDDKLDGDGLIANQVKAI